MKLKILFLLISTVAILSCDKLNPTIRFDHKAGDINIDIPATTQSVIQPGSTIKFAEIPINNDIKPTLEANGVSIDQVKSVKVKSVSLIVMQGNFDFAGSIELGLSLSGNETKFAFKNPIPTGVSTLELDIDEQADLTTYLKASSFALIVKGTQRAANSAVTIKATITYTVEATVKK